MIFSTRSSYRSGTSIRTFFLTLHDRLWLELATRALSGVGRTVEVYEVVGQGPSTSPIIRSPSLNSVAELRAQAAERGSSCGLPYAKFKAVGRGQFFDFACGPGAEYEKTP